MHTRLLINTVLLLGTFPLCAAPNVTINCTGNGGPTADIKRGRSSSVLELAQIDDVAGLGLKIYQLHQDLPANATAVETPLDQFYFNAEGNVNVRVDADVTTARQRVNSYGYELIYQATGTPYYGITPTGSSTGGRGTTSIALYPMTTDRVHGGGPSNWYPIPSSTNRAPFGRKLATWMKEVEVADGAMKSIWVGTQEPTHTLGFPGGTATDTEKLTNVRLYIDTWIETAKDMQAAGYKVGGIQLNGSNADELTYAIGQFKTKGCPFNYITIQQYKAELSNAAILDAARTGLTSNGYATSKKVLFNRYSVKEDLWFKSSTGINLFLDGEKAVLDQADLVYGYCLEGPEWNNNNLREVMAFLNAMPTSRRPVTLANGLRAFSTTSSDSIHAIVWNPGTSSVAVEIQLNNSATSLDNNSLAVRIGSGTTTTTAAATWNGTTNKISGFSLPANSYALISLK